MAIVTIDTDALKRHLNLCIDSRLHDLHTGTDHLILVVEEAFFLRGAEEIANNAVSWCEEHGKVKA